MRKLRQIEEAWFVCRELFLPKDPRERCRTTGDFQEELLFCLLGGFGVSYEQNLSAWQACLTVRPFLAKWKPDALEATVASILSERRFEPRRRDGTFRKYRFPNRKALLIGKAKQWLDENSPIEATLLSISDEKQRRAFLMRCPGVGPKTSSWILRNIGLGERLAILDVHILRALKAVGRIRGPRELPRDYELIEEAFLQWCSDLQAPPASLDLFVWHWQRGDLKLE